MKLLAALLALPAVALAASTTLSWDSVYDDPDTSLDVVACSDGSHGLEKKGFKTFGDLPNFPNIGGAPAVTVWNSASCGTCWKVTYTDGDGNKKTISILAIDVALNSFNIAKAAMNDLTDGQADELGRVNVTFSQTNVTDCGL